jgi:hypothetical protein
MIRFVSLITAPSHVIALALTILVLIGSFILEFEAFTG